MMIQSIQKGRATTVVTIANIASDRPVSDQLLIGFAMASANENPSSLFGWACMQHPESKSATVQLHTD